MNETRCLTLPDVIAIHERMMHQLGLPPSPLRPAGTLESALNRPQMAAWYEGADIVRQAALLGIGISQAQAFLDGNKRTANVATVSFLRLYGFIHAGTGWNWRSGLKLLRFVRGMCKPSPILRHGCVCELHHRDLEKSATPQGIKAYASRVGWGSTYPNGLMR